MEPKSGNETWRKRALGRMGEAAFRVASHMRQGPGWLVPRDIRLPADPGLLQAWFEQENVYCTQRLPAFARMVTIILPLFVPLDVFHSVNPASLSYSLAIRVVPALLFLTLSFVLESSTTLRKEFGFILSKSLFAAAILVAVAAQLKYSFDFPDRQRAYPGLAISLGLFALRVGPFFTLLLLASYAGIWLTFMPPSQLGVLQDVNFNLFSLLFVAIFVQNIKRDARQFRSDWERKRSDEERIAAHRMVNAYLSVLDRLNSPLTSLREGCRKLDVELSELDEEFGKELGMSSRLRRMRTVIGRVLLPAAKGIEELSKDIGSYRESGHHIDNSADIGVQLPRNDTPKAG